MNNNNVNPGKELRNFLKSLYPLDSFARSSAADLLGDKNNKLSFIHYIDHDIKAEGEFLILLHESIINYLARRFINTAEYLRRKLSKNSEDDAISINFINELRVYITENTRLRKQDYEKLLILLERCLDAKDKNLKTSIKKRIKERDGKLEMRCYICGESLSTNDNKDEIMIDHIFPRSMGGATEEYNLKVSCRYCNKAKKNYIDSSDFHYEKICLITDKDDNSFKSELEKEYKIAILSKNKYGCKICGKLASEVGKLNFGRLNTNDSWHFLNIDSYCDDHAPK